MTFSSTCPLCGNEIPSERILDGSAVCTCGWCDLGARKKVEEKQQITTIKMFAAVAAILIVGYGHLLTWGSYSGSIPFLKIGQMTGLLSPAGYEQIIEACTVQNRWGCAEQAHIDLYRKTADPEVIGRLAKLQFLLKENQQSAASYETYFKIGGKNPEIPFFYGQVLEAVQQPDKAMEMYRKSIAENGTKLSVNATSSLVHILLAQKNYNEARIVVDAFHQSAENAKGYLNAEADQIEKILGPDTVKKLAKQ